MEYYENNIGSTKNDFNNKRIVPIKECRFRAIIIFPLGIVSMYALVYVDMKLGGKEILAKFIPKSLSRNKMKIEFGQKSELEHKNNI